MLLSASTFYVAVSAGLDVVRPAMGAIKDGRSCVRAGAPSDTSMTEAAAAQA